MIDGTCTPCEDFTHPDEADRECIFDICNELEILVANGTCERCPGYSNANEKEVLSINGTCYHCHDYEHPDEDGKECISDNCTS